MSWHISSSCQYSKKSIFQINMTPSYLLQMLNNWTLLAKIEDIEFKIENMKNNFTTNRCENILKSSVLSTKTERTFMECELITSNEPGSCNMDIFIDCVQKRDHHMFTNNTSILHFRGKAKSECIPKGLYTLPMENNLLL
nr:ORF69 [Bracoviriform inaniti]